MCPCSPLKLAPFVLLCAIIACACGSSSPASTPTPAPSPTAGNSAYLTEASRLIGLTNDAISYINDLMAQPNHSAEWQQKMALAPLAFGVYAEQWRENEAPESYRNRQDVVQRALDRLEEVGNSVTGGTLDVADLILAQTTFKSAAENFNKPAP